DDHLAAHHRTPRPRRPPPGHLLPRRVLRVGLGDPAAPGPARRREPADLRPAHRRVRPVRRRAGRRGARLGPRRRAGPAAARVPLARPPALVRRRRARAAGARRARRARRRRGPRGRRARHRARAARGRARVPHRARDRPADQHLGGDGLDRRRPGPAGRTARGARRRRGHRSAVRALPPAAAAGPAARRHRDRHGPAPGGLAALPRRDRSALRGHRRQRARRGAVPRLVQRRDLVGAVRRGRARSRRAGRDDRGAGRARRRPRGGGPPL
ncbi:MAG: hypothetical protein AVDCRST_MAG66-2023, partial [uncultured Pseudonocardia sp.]